MYETWFHYVSGSREKEYQKTGLHQCTGGRVDIGSDLYNGSSPGSTFYENGEGVWLKSN